MMSEGDIGQTLELPAGEVSRRRKMFYDWLDHHRPWADPGRSANLYGMMEEIVDAAAWCFLGDDPPSIGQIQSLVEMLNRVTEGLESHPEGHEGPCMCAECRSS